MKYVICILCIFTTFPFGGLMSRKKNEKSDEFTNIFADAEFNKEVEDAQQNMFSDESIFGEEEYEEEHEEEQYEIQEQNAEPNGNIIHKVTNLAKDNKVATAGVVGALSFGLWKLFGTQEEQTSSKTPEGQQNSVPQDYEDEFLGLDDEEDSIDEFIETNNRQQINPMFTPLRFK